MTVQEFKEKYPHLAHLEGDALWDAMSMAVFVDSEGNAIETEDELQKVLREKFTDDLSFEDRFSNFGLLIPKGSVKNASGEQPALKPKYMASGKPDIKNMSFDEVAKWAKQQGKK